MKLFARFMKDESGATAIEYALLAGLIGVGIVTAAGNLKTSITDLFAVIKGKLDGAAAAK
nr:Flp family type IVb pilin [uncultured Cohaesibacter sp.]